MSLISIVGLNKADVLAVLYNAAKPQGLGFMAYDPTPMTREKAQELLARMTNFPYLIGRVMKVDLTSDVEFESRGYDCDNGEGTVEQAIEELRRYKGINTPVIKAVHHENTLAAALEVQIELKRHTKSGRVDDHTYVLGIGKFGSLLGPRIKQVLKKG